MTFAELKQIFAQRLGDPQLIFWPEAGDLLKDALREWQAMTGWKTETRTLSVGTQRWYRLDTLSGLANPPETDVVAGINAALMEPSGQFSTLGITNALNRRTHQMVLESQCRLVLGQYTYPANANSYALPSSLIDLYRVSAGSRLLVSVDEWSVRNFSLGSSGTPESYRLRSKALSLYPRPSTNTVIDTLETSSDGANQVPANFLPYLRWAVLADVLSTDGQGYDPVRAAYANQRYQLGVELLKVGSRLISVRLNGANIPTTAVTDLDLFFPLWQSSVDDYPQEVAVAGFNLIGFDRVPFSPVSVELEVFADAPLPANDSATVDIWPEHVAAVLDLAHHNALFKCGGEEWAAGQEFYNRALSIAQEHAHQRQAKVLFDSTLKEQSRREDISNPQRRNDG